MLEFFEKFGNLLWKCTADTLFMTFLSTALAYVLGLPLGVLLKITNKNGIAQSRAFNSVGGAVINVFRSLPFMILMIFVIPLTRAIVGTSIGPLAAVVPLVIGASPFIARLVESSLEEVDPGVIEAARCMGATNFQIITRVLLVESVPSLLRGASIATITIMGYTAITGAIGAGGLGDLAYRYGYQRYQPSVMYATVIILILLVGIVQTVFNTIGKKLDKRISG